MADEKNAVERLFEFLEKKANELKAAKEAEKAEIADEMREAVGDFLKDKNKVVEKLPALDRKANLESQRTAAIELQALIAAELALKTEKDKKAAAMQKALEAVVDVEPADVKADLEEGIKNNPKYKITDENAEKIKSTAYDASKKNSVLKKETNITKLTDAIIAALDEIENDKLAIVLKSTLPGAAENDALSATIDDKVNALKADRNALVKVVVAAEMANTILPALGDDVTKDSYTEYKKDNKDELDDQAKALTTKYSDPKKYDMKALEKSAKDQLHAMYQKPEDVAKFKEVMGKDSPLDTAALEVQKRAIAAERARLAPVETVPVPLILEKLPDPKAIPEYKKPEYMPDLSDPAVALKAKKADLKYKTAEAINQLGVEGNEQAIYNIVAAAENKPYLEAEKAKKELAGKDWAVDGGDFEKAAIAKVNAIIDSNNPDAMARVSDALKANQPKWTKAEVAPSSTLPAPEKMDKAVKMDPPKTPVVTTPEVLTVEPKVSTPVTPALTEAQKIDEQIKKLQEEKAKLSANPVNVLPAPTPVTAPTEQEKVAPKVVDKVKERTEGVIGEVEPNTMQPPRILSPKATQPAPTPPNLEQSIREGGSDFKHVRAMNWNLDYNTSGINVASGYDVPMANSTYVLNNVSNNQNSNLKANASAVVTNFDDAAKYGPQGRNIDAGAGGFVVLNLKPEDLNRVNIAGSNNEGWRVTMDNKTFTTNSKLYVGMQSPTDQNASWVMEADKAKQVRMQAAMAAGVKNTEVASNPGTPPTTPTVAKTGPQTGVGSPS